MISIGIVGQAAAKKERSSEVAAEQNNLCPCKSIIPHHRNRLYYRAVAVVELNLKGIECDYSITALNRGDCSDFGLVFISNREK